MSERRPGGPPRPFTPAELDGAPGIPPDELAGGTRIARELEAVAARTPVVRSSGFADRVMDAIAAEPSPVPVRMAGRALRRGAVGALLGSLRDAWRVSIHPGFPMAARAQAMALVLVVAGLAAGSGMATVGALGLLDGSHQAPRPAVEPPSPPVTAPTPPVSVSPAPRTDTPVTPEPVATPEPSETPEPSDGPEATNEPRETEDHGGNGGRATATPEPADDGEDSHDDSPSATSEPGDGEHASTPEPTDTPGPTQTSSDD